MGYYKKLSTDRSAGSRVSNKSGTASVDITTSVDASSVFKVLDDLRQYKQIKKTDIKNAHRLVALSGKRKYRNAIKDYHKVIQVRRGSGTEIDVHPGSLRKSISAIDPGNGTNYWLGPKTRGGLKGKGPRVSKSDGWFAHIVEMGANYFGAGRNEGVFEKNRNAVLAVMQKNANRQHKRLLESIYK